MAGYVWGSKTGAGMPKGIRLLSKAEVALVSGGDDGSCSASGCDGVGVGDDGAVGTLSEVTVSATQGTGIGDAQALTLVNQMEFALIDPAAAMFGLMSLIGNSSFPSLAYPPIPVNPMGDPSPAGGP